MEEGWEIFIAKDDTRRCPDGYHKDTNEESGTYGQCVDANGNVYEGKSSESEATDNTEQTDGNTDGNTKQTDNNNENNEQSKGELADEKTVAETSSRLKQFAVSMKTWAKEKIGGYKLKAPKGGEKATVDSIFSVVIFPMASLAKGLLNVINRFVKGLESKNQQKIYKTAIEGYTAGINCVCDALGMTKKQLENKKEWTEKDAELMKQKLDKRIGELLKSDQVKKVAEELRKGRLDKKYKPNLTEADMNSKEYMELRAIMAIMKQADKNVKAYEEKCIEHGLQVDTNKIFSEQREKARRLSGEGSNSYDGKNNWILTEGKRRREAL